MNLILGSCAGLYTIAAQLGIIKVLPKADLHAIPSLPVDLRPVRVLNISESAHRTTLYLSVTFSRTSLINSCLSLALALSGIPKAK